MTDKLLISGSQLSVAENTSKKRYKTPDASKMSSDIAKGGSGNVIMKKVLQREQADSDDDRDRPKIFIRNFAEISEQQSDDDEGDDDDDIIAYPIPCKKKKRYEDEKETGTSGGGTIPKYNTSHMIKAPFKKPVFAFSTLDNSSLPRSDGKNDAVIAGSMNQKQERRDIVRDAAFALRKGPITIERNKLEQQRNTTNLMQAPMPMTPPRPSMGPLPRPIQVSRPRRPGPVYIQPSPQRMPMPRLPYTLPPPSQPRNSLQQHHPNVANSICFNPSPKQPLLHGETSLGQQIFTFSSGLQIIPIIQPVAPAQPFQRLQAPPPSIRFRQPIHNPNQILMPNQTRPQRPPAPTQQVNIPRAISQVQFPTKSIAPPGPPPARLAPLPKIVQNSQRSSLTNSLQKINSVQNVEQRKPPSSLHQITANASAETGRTGNTQRSIPGTRVTGSKSDPENKTFPSLVVQVKTCLRMKSSPQIQTKSRSDLDTKVKSLLVHSPSKFVEWLLKRGLLKLEQRCPSPQHHQPLKLGIYTDVTQQPFSGGYVWMSECCPERHVSIFDGSIFEGSKYPPETLLKLVYHWSCQNPAGSVLQWVKVTKFYLKNFFTLLRAVCISWLHEHCPLLGGERKFVEIGVITLSSKAETSRGVKIVNVEILGVFDPTTKIIRMKVINSLQGLSKDKGQIDTNNQAARAFQILWALTHWVDKRSTIVVDRIIDKTLFHEVGFKNTLQCSENSPENAHTNCNVMNYLRQTVPNMFSSTLSVLSKSIVQQFLDELSWREMYGSSVLQTFENILDHIGGMTKWNLPGGLIPWLNKVSQNPFADWSFTKQQRRSPLNTIPISLRNEAGIKKCIQFILKDENYSQTPTLSHV